MTVQEEKLREQYIHEKSLIEQNGYHSIMTFEAWLEIQRIKTLWEERRNNRK